MRKGQPVSDTIHNLFIKRLAREDFLRVEPFLERVTLPLKQEIIVPGEPITHVWFPESGMISVIAQAAGAEAIEVGLIGDEGMTDHLTAPGDTSVLKFLVQFQGTALAVEAARYLEWVSESPAVLKLILKYQQSMIVQTAHTALSHGTFTIPERLARWLLMSFDRSHDEDLPLVHEFLAVMLGVRRSGVSDAVARIEGHGAIKATRAKIKLLSRDILLDLCGGSYGIPEAEYARLMGPLPS
ncbi:MAG: putative transcriptional regulator, Crp/Fnr family [Hyphomicrobiales bacterium]|nr:putative transcriptional regulator, Crp/Fnr family [Hyphomicrobiales bacterium]